MKRDILMPGGYTVNVSWENNDSWQLSHTAAAVADGVDELTLTLTGSSENEFPAMLVAFRIPKGEIATRWNANLHLDKTLLPEWGETFISELASGAPVLGLINQDDTNAMCCSVSDALRRIVWQSGVKEHTFEINTQLKFFTMPEPPGTFYQVKLRFDRRRIHFSQAIGQAFESLEKLPE